LITLCPESFNHMSKLFKETILNLFEKLILRFDRNFLDQKPHSATVIILLIIDQPYLWPNILQTQMLTTHSQSVSQLNFNLNILKFKYFVY
jgi:hypothetical protein